MRRCAALALAVASGIGLGVAFALVLVNKNKSCCPVCGGELYTKDEFEYCSSCSTKIKNR